MLRDRLAANEAAREAARATLERWVGDAARNAEQAFAATAIMAPKRNGDATALAAHPRLRVLNAVTKVADQGVALARTAYAPDWSFEVTYGVDYTNFYIVIIIFTQCMFLNIYLVRHSSMYEWIYFVAAAALNLITPRSERSRIFHVIHVQNINKN